MSIGRKNLEQASVQAALKAYTNQICIHQTMIMINHLEARGLQINDPDINISIDTNYFFNNHSQASTFLNPVKRGEGKFGVLIKIQMER